MSDNQFIINTLSRLADEMEQMRRAQLQLVSLTERQTHTLAILESLSKRVDAHDTRLMAIEIKQPQLMETRSWVLLAAAAIISMFFTFLSGRVLNPERPHAPPPKAALVDRRASAIISSGDTV
jgi:hypothetical protein